MENESKYQGELLTFYQLLEKYPIEVPIIQRDYAQGRDNQKKVRTKFLKALHDSLSKNEVLMLDFIYGSIDDNNFQPLDGQQRLTTLFLLHCYVCMVDKVPYNEYNLLKNFSYETRMTSRDFCRELVDNLSNFYDLESKIGTSPDPKIFSTMIKDSSWFFLSWKSDPTISAMLNTLDDIHQNFNDIEDIWNKLTKDNIIKFYYIELENLGLTDDLYIKMNARGKLLTTFENLKAGIEKKVFDNKWEDNIHIEDTFKVKIDTKWTDFFWSNFRVNTSTDESFVRFIAFVTMVDSAFSEKSDSNSDLIRFLQDNSHNITIERLDLLVFKRLINYFDLLADNYPEFLEKNINLQLFEHQPEVNLLHEVLTNTSEASYTQKVLLFAQIKYFENLNESKKFDSELYNNWMRVIRNIIAFGNIEATGNRNSIIRSPQAFTGVLNLISDLSEGSSNIYVFLADHSNHIASRFSDSQIKEERAKAHLILEDPTRKNFIHKLEDTDTLRGRLGFIFDCIEYEADFNNFDDENFSDISAIFLKYLSERSCLTNDLRRALLTIEVDSSYNFYDYWQSYWYLEGMNKRKLIDNYREIEYLLNYGYAEFFKKLIYQLKTMDMQEIAIEFDKPEGFPNWKYRLIKERKLLDDAKSNYIAIAEDNSFCYLLKSIRPRNLEGSTKVV
ncbi:DUF262 domain-containing protein [Psychrobacter aestuarii]|uniref:GmrSD restriction endonucleases N-terminal domain-containing protein n=1 Tax=Psychrobacter aestuarii TaxID=556327 RepID=A0ABP3FU17_9GAMM|nr:DUF262 domain-containing protein [Psychrobacter aestuarii]